ncbi:hypothetical protein [Phenylobacterium aquaticum]|uniref:hypothetical protein n=1 Tax=Phenylobacterium aquaticum TaxID=1763816 RepID=UPI001F5D4263|nr:hypothetical protein [Phenylobacterium aquaticum]MCI3134810.1 hypothetical protein [Phenylobacterium aquaticum]
MSVPAIAAVLTPCFFITAMLAPSATTALALLVLPGLLGSLWYGPIYATVQGLVPLQMRTTAASIILFIINLIGLGLGPLFVGALSDILAGPVGLGSANGVRWALICSSSLGVVACGLFWMARKSIREEMVS